MNSSFDRPKLTVIMPSYNGADTLPECLSALASLALPAGGVEFVFVDNRSTDATADLLAEAAQTLTGRFLSEPRPGKSFALNAAIEVSQGDLLVFTDDDTLPRAEWLTAFAAAAAAHPEVGIFAGQIRPHWVAAVPAWLMELAQRGLVAGCTPANHPPAPYPTYWVKGANVMFRRNLLAQTGFDTGSVNFGATSAAIGGEDTKLVQDLVASGQQLRYVPDACLSHIVQPEETTVRFVLSRQVRIGRGNAIAEGIGLARAIRLCADIGAYALITPFLYLLGKRASAALQVMKSARRIGMLQVWLRGRG